MGLRVLLGFLGLQLLLFCSVCGTDAGSRTPLQSTSLDHGSETRPLLQAEVPAFGLGLKYLVPQDPQAILMKHRTRERRQVEKKKKKKPKPGTFSVLSIAPVKHEQKPTASYRAKRHPVDPPLSLHQRQPAPPGGLQVNHGSSQGGNHPRLQYLARRVTPTHKQDGV